MEQGKELSQFTAREWGVLLTRIRQHIDKTQPEMADLLDAGLTTYQKWEWGRRKPRAEYRRRIRKAFEEILYMWGILQREGEPESLIPLGGSEKQQLMEDDKTTESPVPVVAKHLQSSLGSEDNVDTTIPNPIGPPQEQDEGAQNETAVSSSSLAQENVIQSERIIQLSGIASLWTHSQDILPLDLPTRLFARVNELKATGNRQSQVMTDVEIKSWTIMTDQDHQLTSNTLTTRRDALVALALFPPTLLAKIQSWSSFDMVSTVVAEDFLTQCAHSITACNHLLKGDGLATIEYALSQYLPQLLTLGKSPSPVQHEAANLASQGCCLMSTIKTHRVQYHEAVTCCKQAVEMAKVTGDNQLVAAALTELGDAWFYVDQPQKYLKAYQESESLIPRETKRLLLAKEPDQFPLLLQCCIYTGLSDAYAVLERSQEAEHYLNLANAIPLSPDDDRFIPALSYDFSSRAGHTGSIERKLGEMEDKKKAPDKARPHYEKAEAMLMRHSSRT